MLGKMKDKPKLSLADFQSSTKMLHEELSSDQELLCRYSYKYAGRFLIPTYEQWELGLLSEKDLQGELLFWTAISAYIKQGDFDTGETRRLITEWCSGRCHPQLEARIKRAAGGTVDTYLTEAREDGCE